MAITVADTGLAGLIVPRTPRQLGTARPIDLAYAAANALGGYVDTIDREAVARDEMLAQVLDILERHGAIDPDLALPAASRSEAA